MPGLTFKHCGFLLLILLPLAGGPLAQSTALNGTLSNGWTVRLNSQLQPLTINRLHSWQIELRDSEGAGLDGANIEVIGGMPEHDHGLPTMPVVIADDRTGHYLLQGMRFHMPGHWQLRVSISRAGFNDEIVLDLHL